MPGGTIPVKNSFAFQASAVNLEQPHVATAPIQSSGFVLAHQSFIVLWMSPSTATQNAMVNGSVAQMTFSTHDGKTTTANVKVSSVLVNSVFVTALTVLAITKAT